MTNSSAFDRRQRENAAERRSAIRRWAEFVRTHDDEEWSLQQNRLVNAQLESANAAADRGDTDPEALAAAKNRIRKQE